MRTHSLTALLFCLLTSGATHAAEITRQQHRSDDTPPLALSVWQPTQPGNGALVVLSVGLGGSPRGLSATAQAIAATGITVVAPQHSSDQLIGTRLHLFAMENRADEVLRARRWALQRLELDPARVGFLGYSQGGLSVIIAAGARPDVFRAREHCAANRADDRGYCGHASLWRRALQTLGLSNLLVDRDDPAQNFRHQRSSATVAALAVAAPVAAIVPPEAFRSISANIGIYSFGADRVLAPKFHADHLHDALQQRPHTYISYPGEGHGVLWGPNAAQINTDIALFFAKHLLPQEQATPVAE